MNGEGAGAAAAAPSGPVYTLRELPNLYVASITPAQNEWGEHVTVAADTPTLRMDHSDGLCADVQNASTPGLAVNACADLTRDVLGEASASHYDHV